MNSMQFAIPAERRDVVVAEVARVGQAHGMRDCMGGSDVVGATGCFLSGDTSFTFLGVRQVGDRMVVDVGFRSAGIGGDLYKVITEELRTGLRRGGGAGIAGREGPDRARRAAAGLTPSLRPPASSPRP